MKALFFFLLGLTYHNTNAQQPTRSSIDTLAKKASMDLKHRLNISEDQRVKFQEAWKLLHTVMNVDVPLEKNSKEKKKIAKKAEKHFDQSIKNIFTEDQYSAYQNMVKDRKAAFKARNDAKGIKIKEAE